MAADYADAGDIDLDAFEREQIPVLLEGYLLKKKTKGMTLGKWQKRHFCLDNTTKSLTYSSSEQSMQKKMIPFNHIEDVKIIDNKGGGKRFEIIMLKDTGGEEEKNKGRHFILEAETKDEADNWVENLKKLSNKYRARKRKHKENVKRHRGTMISSDNQRFARKLDASPKLKQRTEGRQRSASKERMPAKTFSMAMERERENSNRSVRSNQIAEEDEDTQPTASKCFCCAVQ